MRVAANKAGGSNVVSAAAAASFPTKGVVVISAELSRADARRTYIDWFTKADKPKVGNLTPAPPASLLLLYPPPPLSPPFPHTHLPPIAPSMLVCLLKLLLL
jgi:hypothetical protein